jgi:hypothetical protein
MVRLKRGELDNPHVESTWKYYNEDFAVELYFREALEEMDDELITENLEFAPSSPSKF